MSQPSQSIGAPSFGVPFTVHSEQALVPSGEMKCWHVDPPHVRDDRVAGTQHVADRLLAAQPLRLPRVRAASHQATPRPRRSRTGCRSTSWRLNASWIASSSAIVTLESLLMNDCPARSARGGLKHHDNDPAGSASGANSGAIASHYAGTRGLSVFSPLPVGEGLYTFAWRNVKWPGPRKQGCTSDLWQPWDRGRPALAKRGARCPRSQDLPGPKTRDLTNGTHTPASRTAGHPACNVIQCARRSRRLRRRQWGSGRPTRRVPACGGPTCLAIA